MSTETLDVYNLLIDAGITKEKAEPLAREILSRSEAKEIFASKADLYRAMTIQAGFIITAIGLIVTIAK